MAAHFSLPDGVLGRFGVIKLWPDIQVAEDELIARLVNTAQLLGLQCVVLDHLGRSLQDQGRPMTNDDLDFVIHMHFSTPKSYDIFSFVTLWNPPQFFHDFGYRAMAENLLTHDDWLSCRSPGADMQLRRLIHDDPSHLEPTFELFHSLAAPILPPSAGDGRIFYMGINWERLGRRQSRHQSVLNLLEETGLLRIYGPEELRGVKVWEGFRSYQRPLPFDGVSIIEEIHRAGICLALSSQPHKDAALMSSRLFEGLAAGALIICDENPWARTHFGETLLYVDLRDSAEAVARQIAAYVDWARQDAVAALALAARAQAIFRQRFTMDGSLASLYAGLQARKAELAARCRTQPGEAPVMVVFLLPDPTDEAIFDRQFAAARGQIRQGFASVLLVDHADVPATAAQCAARPGSANGPTNGQAVAVRGAALLQRAGCGRVTGQHRLGSILKEVFEAAPALLCVVQPDETVFSNHVALLAAAIGRNPAADYAWSKVVQVITDKQGEPHCVVAATLDLLSRDPAAPLGSGRFLFRADRFRLTCDLLLESLDGRAAAGLALHAAGCPSGRASLLVDRRGRHSRASEADKAAERTLNAAVWRDLEAIRDLDAVRFDALDADHLLRDQVHEMNQHNQHSHDILHKAFHNLHVAFENIRDNQNRQQAFLGPDALSLDRLSRANRRAVLSQLLESLPVPELLWRLLRKALRTVRSAVNLVRGGR